MGIAGATNSSALIFIGGVAGVVAGIIAMSIGEYLSVSSLRDSEKAYYKISPESLTDPMTAAIASARAYLLGSLVPLFAILMPPPPYRIYITFISVIIALAATGYFGAKAGSANHKPAIIRVVLGGTLAMIITYTIGRLFALSGI